MSYYQTRQATDAEQVMNRLMQCYHSKKKAGLKLPTIEEYLYNAISFLSVR